MTNKKAFLFWLILCVIFFLSFRVLPQKGIIPGEPDEFIYSRVSRDLGWSFPPYYSGAPFIVEPPLFPILAAPFVKVIGDPLFSVRVVSFVFTLALSLAVFGYLFTKLHSQLIAFLGAALFLFNPLTVFYSQVGILEPTLSFFLFLFFVLLDKAVRDGKLWLFLLVGLVSLASILTKYTGLYTIPILLLVFLLRSLKMNVEKREGLSNGYLFWDYKSLLAFLIPTIFSLFLLFYLSRRFPLEFKWQVAEVLGFNGATSFNLIASLKSGLINSLTTSLSPLFLTLVISGLFFSFLNLRTFGPVVGMSLILSALVFSRLPFNFRYLVVLMPFYAILAVIPFVSAGKVTSRFKWLISTVIPLLYFSIISNYLILAYNSSKHSLLEEAVSYLNNSGSTNSTWLLSNYWPNILSSLSGRENVGWLTLDNREISIFTPSEKRTGKEIMETTPTDIIVEDYFSKVQIVANGPRVEAYQYVISRYKPVKVILDTSPNFPFSKSSNRIFIYYLQKP